MIVNNIYERGMLLTYRSRFFCGRLGGCKGWLGSWSRSRGGRDRIGGDDDDLRRISHIGSVILNDRLLTGLAGAMVVSNVSGAGHDGHNSGIGETVARTLSFSLARRG